VNKLKKGPEINLRDIKVPAFLQDLYYDLKDRHLLPLVALLIVAIVAAPIALGQSGSEEAEAEGAAEASVATPSAAASGSGELVAKATPGLRDYRKRLSRMEAENPFQQQFDDSGAEEGSSAAASESETGGSISVPTTEPSAPSSSPIPTDENGEPDPDRLTYFSYAIDVRVVPGRSGDWEGGTGKPQVRRNLPELTMLPSRETPAVIYMGSTKDGKKALMMVSSNVEGIFGDATCALGSDSCQLLVMEPGIPETFVYGGEGRTFKIELLKVHLVATDKLNRAPLGKPKQGKSNDNG
jgi:hypothetical protein